MEICLNKEILQLCSYGAHKNNYKDNSDGGELRIMIETFGLKSTCHEVLSLTANITSCAAI